MVVDDEPVNRMVHKMHLQNYGSFIVSEHKTGKEAVEFICTLKDRNPGRVLILMDINMPVMNGIEATKAIRAMTFSFPVVIVAVSAFSSEEDINRIMSCGMDSYVIKPLTKDKLAKMLDTL